MIDGGPLYGGASAVLVIHDEPQFLRQIEDCLKSVIGVASMSDGNGEFQFNLVKPEYRVVPKVLTNDILSCEVFPVFVFFIQYHPTPDAAPEPVS